jgi:hypothetical protein
MMSSANGNLMPQRFATAMIQKEMFFSFGSQMIANKPLVPTA